MWADKENKVDNSDGVDTGDEADKRVATRRTRVVRQKWQKTKDGSTIFVCFLFIR